MEFLIDNDYIIILFNLPVAIKKSNRILILIDVHLIKLSFILANYELISADNKSIYSVNGCRFLN